VARRRRRRRGSRRRRRRTRRGRRREGRRPTFFKGRTAAWGSASGVSGAGVGGSVGACDGADGCARARVPEDDGFDPDPPPIPSRKSHGVGSHSEKSEAKSWSSPSSPPLNRGLHSSTSQLNLSRVWHNKTPYTPYNPYIRPNNPFSWDTQPLRAPPIPYKALELSRKVNECKLLPLNILNRLRALPKSLLRALSKSLPSSPSPPWWIPTAAAAAAAAPPPPILTRRPRGFIGSCDETSWLCRASAAWLIPGLPASAAAAAGLAAPLVAASPGRGPSERHRHAPMAAAARCSQSPRARGCVARRGNRVPCHATGPRGSPKGSRDFRWQPLLIGRLGWVADFVPLFLGLTNRAAQVTRVWNPGKLNPGTSISHPICQSWSSCVSSQSSRSDIIADLLHALCEFEGT